MSNGLGRFFTSCEDCLGGGEVSTPEWIDWRRAFSDAEKEDGMSILVAGYTRWQDNYIATHAYPSAGETMACPECDGSGVQLTAEGSDLVAFLMKVGFVKNWQLKPETYAMTIDDIAAEVEWMRAR